MKLPFSTIVHVTNLNSLYSILQSGYIQSRYQTGAVRGYSCRDKGDPRFVYFSLDPEEPRFCNVKLVLNSSILLDRDDYYLNTDWIYGVTPNSFNPSQLKEWYESMENSGEILFSNEVPVDKYLEEIVIAQMTPKIHLQILNINKIPSRYQSKIRIVYE